MTCNEMIELSTRKYTTDEGLEKLASIVCAVSKKMPGDLWNFQSKKVFGCKVHQDNGYPSNDIYYNDWYSEYGFFRYENGYVKLYVYNENFGSEECLQRSEYINRIHKINFTDAIASLKEVVDEYNSRTQTKDAEIEKFLNLCNEYLEV